MKKVGVLLLVFVFLVSFASARLIISEPEEIYNLGDKLYVAVDDIKGGDSGNLNINLVCGNDNVNLLKISARAFSPEGGQSYSLPYKILTKEDLEIDALDGIIGECHVSVSIGTEIVSGKSFQISSDIIIDGSVDKLNYDPGEEITLTVEAAKANGDLVEGFIEGGGVTDFSKIIEAGVATEIFSMPEATESGTYVLDLFVYDTTSDDDGEVLNQGKVKVEFSINQIASFIEPSLSALEITPEEELTISVDIYDQSGKEMGGDVSVLLVSPDGEEIEKVVAGGEFVSFDFPLNAAAGKWQIFSSFADIVEESEFEMLEFQKVVFEFQGPILIVKNVGNTKYDKAIEVDIAGEVQKIDLDMGVGEEKRFNLKAPDGEYEVSVGDGETTEQSRVALTGNAISIKDLESIGIFKGYSIVWIFIIVVLGGIAAVLFLKFKKKTIKIGGKIKAVPGKFREVTDKVKGTIGGKIPAKVSDTLPFTNKSPASQSLDETHEGDHGMIDLTQAKVGRAEASLVLKGEKNPSAVISLHIKNYDSLKNDVKKRLAAVVSGVKENKGLVDWRGEHVFIVFSPLVTKTFDNEILAAKAGFNLFEKLNAGNKKFKDKIDFNIGINSGDLVASREKGKLKYTSIGNTIALAKRIADSASGKLLVSDSVRKKLMKDLRAEKVGLVAKTAVWEVSKMVDRSANEEKLHDILHRMKQEEKYDKKK